MVWYGMVWYGMVWYGMVWYGMVWYGMVWYGMVWYGMVWYGMVWYGMVWYGMKRKILINTDADERASGPAFPCDVSESTYMHLCRLLQRVHYRLLVALACGRHLLQRQTQTEASEILYLQHHRPACIPEPNGGAPHAMTYHHTTCWLKPGDALIWSCMSHAPAATNTM